MEYLQNPSDKNVNIRRYILTGEKRDGTFAKWEDVKLAQKWRYLIDADFKFSKKCCNILKINPAREYEKRSRKKPFIGLKAIDSSSRAFAYKRGGCNNFISEHPRSNPLAFWTEKDIWDYIKQFNVPYSKIYNMGYKNTGCIFCMFGVHFDKYPNRFQLMKQTHPQLYKYCIFTLGLNKILELINVDYK